MGKVYLVGAGSGDPELLTLKGQRVIAQADVIIYDRLVHPLLLYFAQSRANFVYCGKIPYRHAMKQAEINQMLIEYGKQEKTVVRLKGGDPSIFGRVAEEVAQLEEHKIPYEIVPGITAASAVSSYAGFSLTHRNLSSRVTLATAHRQFNQIESLDFAALANGGTLCFYMGIENLSLICEQLQVHGAPPNMPIALVEWATLGKQHTLIGKLSDIEQKVAESGLANPALIIVGEVVQLRKQISWFERLPLFGQKILLVSQKALSLDFLLDYTSQGADIWNLQLGEARDHRFDEVSLHYLKEQTFQAIWFETPELAEKYHQWIKDQSLPDFYQKLTLWK